MERLIPIRKPIANFEKLIINLLFFAIYLEVLVFFYWIIECIFFDAIVFEFFKIQSHIVIRLHFLITRKQFSAFLLILVGLVF